MKTFAILRRCGWDGPEALDAAAKRSNEVGNEQMADQVRWIRSYVLAEGAEGSLGTVCVYQATTAEALREHAKLADLPCDEVVEVADTVIVRPDPKS